MYAWSVIILALAWRTLLDDQTAAALPWGLPIELCPNSAPNPVLRACERDSLCCVADGRRLPLPLRPPMKSTMRARTPKPRSSAVASVVPTHVLVPCTRPPSCSLPSLHTAPGY